MEGILGVRSQGTPLSQCKHSSLQPCPRERSPQCKSNNSAPQEKEGFPVKMLKFLSAQVKVVVGLCSSKNVTPHIKLHSRDLLGRGIQEDGASLEKQQ